MFICNDNKPLELLLIDNLLQDIMLINTPGIPINENNQNCFLKPGVLIR